MPMYPFRCKLCGAEDVRIMSVEEYAVWSATAHLMCDCTPELTRMSRVFSFTATPIFEAHHSDTTGQYVHSKREFADQLKALSDDATSRTGIAHDLVPMDLRDLASDTPDAGMDSTHDRQVAAGMKSPISSPLR